jgi:hypothetical protein
MNGQRLPDGTDWSSAVPNGAYWKSVHDGRWDATTPNGLLANLRGHQVTEHDDGTITVSPSIEVNRGRANPTKGYWHGFLERGVWRSC